MMDQQSDVCQLLNRLRQASEQVVCRANVSNVWLSYGVLTSMTNCISNILHHGLTSRNGSEEVLNLIRRLFGRTILSVDRWIQEGLVEYCMTSRFALLLGDGSNLDRIYSTDAFLRLPAYVDAMLSCLRSIEQRDCKFLASINPALYISPSNAGIFLTTSKSLSVPTLSKPAKRLHISPSTESDKHRTATCKERCCEHCIRQLMTHLVMTVSDVVNHDAHVNTVNATLPRPASSPSMANTHRRTRSDDPFVRRLQQSKSSSNASTTRNLIFSSILRDVRESTDCLQKSLAEAAQLREYLAHREYETTLELEKENAHFALSELLIGAIEQMKWRNVFSTMFTDTHSRSDTLSPAPRSEEQLDQHLFSDRSCNSDLVLSVESPNSMTNSYEFVKSAEVPSTSAAATDAGYSTDSWQRGHQERRLSSAESVAMSLLERYSRTHFSSQTNEQQYLVSYKDVPQLLLPLPQSIPVSPDEIYAEGFRQKIKLRGTFEWAPPRPQLIFRIHPILKLKTLLDQQLYKCAGCGMKIDRAYIKRLRYCYYLGKMFCQRCHQGQTSIVPANVLHKWDFHLYSVSDFSYRFLSQNYNLPVWNVEAVNAPLYSSVKPLRNVRRIRQQLHFCWDYIRTCRLAENLITKSGKLTDVFSNIPNHLKEETDLYSMEDFVQVKAGVMLKKLEANLLLARYHIEGCEFCRAKGFICELCRSDEILFPFQADDYRVKRCAQCGQCFHKSCLRRLECPKCRRVRLRTLTQAVGEQNEETRCE